MKLENYYYYHTSVFSKEFCKDIITYALTKNPTLGKTGLSYMGADEETQLKKRNSNVAFLNESWIYDAIIPYVNTANTNAKWNFEWDYSEACQFTIYEKDQHYGWHIDSNETPYINHNDNGFNGKVRKLSTVISLSDPLNYEGGQFEFDFRNKDEGSNIFEVNEIKPIGSIITFPSFVWHQVKPVTKGTRYSLVLWHLGQPWK